MEVKQGSYSQDGIKFKDFSRTFQGLIQVISRTLIFPNVLPSSIESLLEEHHTQKQDSENVLCTSRLAEVGGEIVNFEAQFSLWKHFLQRNLLTVFIIFCIASESYSHHAHPIEISTGIIFLSAAFN